MSKTYNYRDEIMRVRRVSDMLCTGHARLKQKFVRKAVVLDLLVLIFTAWLVALAFVDHRIDLILTPFDLEGRVWSGILSFGVFVLVLIQFKLDWKSRANGHRRTFEIYANIKREAGYLLSKKRNTNLEIKMVIDHYDLASMIGVEIPENEFLKCKKEHLSKIRISKYLDSHSSASLIIVRLKF